MTSKLFQSVTWVCALALCACTSSSGTADLGLEDGSNGLDAGQELDAADPIDATFDGATPDDAASPIPPAPVIGGAMAEYEVPIDGALAAYARYQITDLSWRIDERGRASLEYTLPAELVGTPQLVNMESTTSAFPVSLSGAVGSATCSEVGARVTCQEMLPGITVDLATVNAAVSSGTISPERASVSAHFSVEPIGIVRFDVL